MTIYVDTLIKHDLTSKPSQFQRVFKDGACHMFTDGPLEELHAAAYRIGMKREWFQDEPFLPHYDLNPMRRAAAVHDGAVECDKYKTVAVMRANRAKRKGAGL
jgi:L,D-peptidoglycan transpeptidase YkuD (ErfK/YbiS/YcfS/YnhG family)